MPDDAEISLYRVLVTYPPDALTVRQRSHLRTRLADRMDRRFVDWVTTPTFGATLRVWIQTEAEDIARGQVARLLRDDPEDAEPSYVDARPWRGLWPAESEPVFFDGETVHVRHDERMGEVRYQGVLLVCSECDNDCGWTESGSGTRVTDFIFVCEQCNAFNSASHIDEKGK